MSLLKLCEFSVSKYEQIEFMQTRALFWLFPSDGKLKNQIEKVFVFTFVFALTLCKRTFTCLPKAFYFLLLSVISITFGKFPDSTKSAYLTFYQRI